MPRDNRAAFLVSVVIFLGPYAVPRWDKVSPLNVACF